MGPTYSISTACATSNFCILSAANHIIKGEAVSFLPWISEEFRKVYLSFLSYVIQKVPFCLMENFKAIIWLQDMMLSGGSEAVIIPIGIYRPSFSL